MINNKIDKEEKPTSFFNIGKSLRNLVDRCSCANNVESKNEMSIKPYYDSEDKREDDLFNFDS